MKKPFLKISNHPVTEKARGIQLQSVTYLDYDLGEARLIFEEVLLDEKDEPIISPIVVPRKMTRFISNSSKVTEEGIMITRENFPINEGESEEDYQKRIDAMLENGIPEFDFWMNMIAWEPLILQGIQMMDQFKSFDRI